jgi:hypothetical protein
MAAFVSISGGTTPSRPYRFATGTLRSPLFEHRE